MRSRRAALAVVALVVAIGLVWAGVSAFSGDGVASAVAERDELVLGVEVTGTLRAVETTVLGPPSVAELWNFKIAMMAPEGVEVRAGQPVLGFDTTELEQKRRTLAAELDAARAEVAKQEVDLAVREAADALAIAEADAGLRKARLLAGTPSALFSSVEVAKMQLDLELAELEVESVRRRVESSRQAGREKLELLKADLARAEAEMARIGDAVARMTRVAPRDGLVIHAMSPWSREKKKVGDTCWAAEPVIEIPELARMEGDGEIEEALAGRVRDGQPVTLRLDAHPDLEHRGTVHSLSRSVQEKTWDNPLKVVRLVVDLERTDPETMRPGMRFRGEVEVARLTDVVTIPLAAVTPTASGPVVEVRRLGGWRTVPVELGERNRTHVEVRSGLAPGDRVALGGGDE